MQSVHIKIKEPSSTKGKIIKRYEIIIKAILMSRAWQALYLTKQGTFGFLTNPAKIIINNNKPPKQYDLSIISMGQVRNDNTFKKEYL